MNYLAVRLLPRCLTLQAGGLRDAGVRRSGDVFRVVPLRDCPDIYYKDFNPFDVDADHPNERGIPCARLDPPELV